VDRRPQTRLIGIILAPPDYSPDRPGMILADVVLDVSIIYVVTFPWFEDET
jgi:hypothetical protein